MLLPRVATAALMFALTGCMPPVMPADKLTDSAYTVVEAARFGRMDIVISAVKPDGQAAYAESHAEWGGNIRILDIEYGGAKLTGADKAVVLMTIAWQRLDESILRSTALKQTWQLASGSRGDRSEGWNARGRASEEGRGHRSLGLTLVSWRS